MEALLKEHFGFSKFRPDQKEIIQNILAGKDSLVIMPTGGGKSLCYQFPSLLLPGLTLVISPLIALMKDQVDNLTQNGISAGFINSTQNQDEYFETMDKLRSGEMKLLYLAPERLALDGFKKFIKTLDISLIAIDEAHCISEWGHEFRPDYRQLSKIRAGLKKAVKGKEGRFPEIRQTFPQTFPQIFHQTFQLSR